MSLVYHEVIIGKDCLKVQSGTVIGSDGFGYANESVAIGLKIPQLGSVIIG